MHNETILTCVGRGSHDEHYGGPNGLQMKREYEGVTPNGNPFGGRWVLRRDGEYIDVDQYRNDLAERNNIELVG